MRTAILLAALAVGMLVVGLTQPGCFKAPDTISINAPVGGGDMTVTDMLKALRKKGVITDAEYDRFRKIAKDRGEE